MLRLQTVETNPSCTGMEPALSPEPTPPPANRGHGVAVGLTAAQGEILLLGARAVGLCWAVLGSAGCCEARGYWYDRRVCAPWV